MSPLSSEKNIVLTLKRRKKLHTLFGSGVFVGWLVGFFSPPQDLQLKLGLQLYVCFFAKNIVLLSLTADTLGVSNSE